MTVYAVQLDVEFPTALERDDAHKKLTNSASTRSKWGTVTIVPTISESGLPSLSVEVRFVLESDAIAVYDQAAADLRWQVGTLSRHACSHDAAVPSPCTAAVQLTRP